MDVSCRLGQLIKLAGLDEGIMPFNRGDLQAARVPYGAPALDLGQSSQQAQIDIHAPTRETISQSSLNDLLLSSQSQRATAPSGAPGKISIVPDNHRQGGDPAMQGPVISSDRKPKTKFDELYAKVLQETDGALDLNRDAGDDVDQRIADKRYTRQGLINERKKQTSSGDLSERSQSSQHSQPTHSRSKHSSASKQPPVPMQRSNSKGSTNNFSARSNGSRSNGSLHKSKEFNHSEHEYSHDFEKTQSDISEDIENIQDIHDLMPVPDNSPFKGMESEEDSF